MTLAPEVVVVVPPPTDRLRVAGPMTATQARQLTDRIRDRFGDLKQLVLVAYEGDVPRVLGYPSWDAYVAGELGIARSHSYRLLEAARAERELGKILAEQPDAGPRVSNGDKITIPEHVTRGIDVAEALAETRGRLPGQGVDPAAVIATFRQVAEEMRHRLPEPDETVAELDARHVVDLHITQITDPGSGGAAYLWESTTGWNRGWVRIVRIGDPRDILDAWSELQTRYRRHLRGEILEGSDLSIARSRAATHDPVDWSGPVERSGVVGWVAPSGHFYPQEATAVRKMLSKRRALGLPTGLPV